jgi:hypothetical protein
MGGKASCCSVRPQGLVVFGLSGPLRPRGLRPKRVILEEDEKGTLR